MGYKILLGPLSDPSYPSLWSPRMTSGCPHWLGGMVTSCTPSPFSPLPCRAKDRHCRNTDGIYLDVFSRNQRIPNSRYEQWSRIGLAGIHEKAPLVSFLPLSLHFLQYPSSWSKSLVAVASLDSAKVSTFFITKVFRGSVEPYYLNFFIF